MKFVEFGGGLDVWGEGKVKDHHRFLAGTTRQQRY